MLNRKIHVMRAARFASILSTAFVENLKANFCRSLFAMLLAFHGAAENDVVRMILPPKLNIWYTRNKNRWCVFLVHSWC